MPRSYELDDILEEIKRKKSERESAAPAEKAQPAVWEEAVPERKPQPKAAVPAPAPVVEQEEKHSSQMMNTAPLGELADFFGNNAKYDIGAEDKKSFRVPAASRRTAVKEEPAAPAVPAAVEESEPVTEAPARPAWNIDQDTWEYKEEPEKRYELDKTQISIPAKQEPVLSRKRTKSWEKPAASPGPRSRLLILKSCRNLCGSRKNTKKRSSLPNRKRTTNTSGMRLKMTRSRITGRRRMWSRSKKI